MNAIAAPLGVSIPLLSRSIATALGVSDDIATPFKSDLSSYASSTWSVVSNALTNAGFKILYSGADISGVNVTADSKLQSPTYGDLLAVSWSTPPGQPIPVTDNGDGKTGFNYLDDSGLLTGSVTFATPSVTFQTTLGVDLTTVNGVATPTFFLSTSTGVSIAGLSATGTFGGDLNIQSLADVNASLAATLSVPTAGVTFTDPHGDGKLRAADVTSIGSDLSPSLSGSLTLNGTFGVTLAHLPQVNWTGAFNGPIDTHGFETAQTSYHLNAPSAADLLSGFAKNFFSLGGGIPILGPLASALDQDLPILDESIAGLTGLDQYLPNLPSLPTAKLLQDLGSGVPFTLQLGPGTLTVDITTDTIDGLLHGQAEDLISWSTGRQSMSLIDWQKTFPLFSIGIPGIASAELDATFGVNATLRYDVGFGIDTHGFYIHGNNDGTDPLVAISFGATAGVQGQVEIFGFPLADAGGDIGFTVTPYISLGIPPTPDNPDHKDRVYLSDLEEFGSSIVGDLFDALNAGVSGDFTGEVYASIDLLFFSLDWNYGIDIPVFNYQKTAAWPTFIAGAGGSDPWDRYVNVNNGILTFDNSADNPSAVGTGSVPGTIGENDNVTLVPNADGTLTLTWAGHNNKTGNDSETYLTPAFHGDPQQYPGAVPVSSVAFLGGTGSDHLNAAGVGVPVTATLNGTAGSHSYVQGGAAGNTIADGGSGTDTLQGGAGADSITGGSGTTVILGGDGSDTLTAGSGPTQIYSGSGNSFLYGGTGPDSLFGGGGNDVIYGGAGLFFIDGGSGNDTIFGYGYGPGGPANVTARVQSRQTGGVASGLTRISGLTDTADLYSGESVAGPGIPAGDVIATVNAAAGTVILGQPAGSATSAAATATNAADPLVFGSTPLIHAGTGHTVVHGGATPTFIYGDGGSGDQLFGGSGRDTIYGGSGGGNLVTGAPLAAVGWTQQPASTTSGVTTITLAGNTAAGLLVGDAVSGAGIQPGTTITGITKTGSGGSATVQLTLSTAATATASNVSLTFGGNTLFGNGDGDTLVGGAGNGTLTAGPGNETLYGGAGPADATLNNLGTGVSYANGTPASTGANLLVAGSGTDVLYGDSSGHNTLQGGTGTDSLYAGPAGDYLAAGTGVQALYGGPGDDSLQANFFTPAGQPADTLDGGAGLNTLVLKPESGGQIAGPGTLVSAIGSADTTITVTNGNVVTPADVAGGYVVQIDGEQMLVTNATPTVETGNVVPGATSAVTAAFLSSNTATLAAANTFAVGQTVTVSGVGEPFDGTYTVTAATPTSFSYALTIPTEPATGTAAVSTAITGESLTSDVATLTAANTFAPGQTVTVTGLGGVFDGTYTVTAATPTAFSYALTAADVPAESASGTATGAAAAVTAKALSSNVATLAVANTFAVGQTVTVSGIDPTFNGTYTVTAATPTTFSYALTVANQPATGLAIRPSVITGLSQAGTLTVGEQVSAAAGLPVGTVVTAISGSTATLSTTATAAVANATLMFSGKLTVQRGYNGTTATPHAGASTNPMEPGAMVAPVPAEPTSATSPDYYIAFAQSGTNQYTATLSNLTEPADTAGSPLGQTTLTLPADVQQVAIEGGPGDNVIKVDPSVARGVYEYGGPGHHTLYGGSGNDTLLGGPGPSVIYGGSGNSLLYGDDLPDQDVKPQLDGSGTVTNTTPPTGNNTLVAGSGSDELFAGNNGDLLIGGGATPNAQGQWVLLPVAGRDVLTGGAGNDLLIAGPTSPGAAFTAGGGNDTLVGGPGQDIMTAGSGNDLLLGGNLTNLMRGGTGNVTMVGGAGIDYELGGSGNNVLYDAVNAADGSAAYWAQAAAAAASGPFDLQFPPQAASPAADPYQEWTALNVQLNALQTTYGPLASIASNPSISGTILPGTDVLQNLPSLSATGDVAAGGDTIQNIAGLDASKSLQAGEWVSGPGLAPGTIVRQVLSKTEVWLSTDATYALAGGTYVFSRQLEVGETVTGTNIPGGTTVAAVLSATSVELSNYVYGRAGQTAAINIAAAVGLNLEQQGQLQSLGNQVQAIQSQQQVDTRQVSGANYLVSYLQGGSGNAAGTSIHSDIYGDPNAATWVVGGSPANGGGTVTNTFYNYNPADTIQGGNGGGDTLMFRVNGSIAFRPDGNNVDVLLNGGAGTPGGSTYTGLAQPAGVSILGVTTLGSGQFQMGAATTGGSPTITGLSSTANLHVGQGVTGPGIPIGATVGSVDSATQVTLSTAFDTTAHVNATASAVGVVLAFAADTVSVAPTLGSWKLFVQAGPGNDLISAPGYNPGETILGGSGNDVIQIAALAATQTTLNGGGSGELDVVGDRPGGDTITVSGASLVTDGVPIAFPGFTKLVAVGGNAGENTFVATDSTIPNVTFEGGGGPNKFNVSGGTVALIGGNGANTFNVQGPGAYTVAGNPVATTNAMNVSWADAGNDSITLGQSGGPSSPVAVKGTLGAGPIAVVATNATAVNVTGGPGNNTLDARGMQGAVTLSGGAGTDTVYGGAGDDTFIEANPSGTYNGGGGTKDTIVLSGPAATALPASLTNIEYYTVSTTGGTAYAADGEFSAFAANWSQSHSANTDATTTTETTAVASSGGNPGAYIAGADVTHGGQTTRGSMVLSTWGLFDEYDLDASQVYNTALEGAVQSVVVTFDAEVSSASAYNSDGSPNSISFGVLMCAGGQYYQTAPQYTQSTMSGWYRVAPSSPLTAADFGLSSFPTGAISFGFYVYINDPAVPGNHGGFASFPVNTVNWGVDNFTESISHAVQAGATYPVAPSQITSAVVTAASGGWLSLATTASVQFGDSNPTAAGDTVNVDWGDGSTTVSTVSMGSTSGTYTATASHVYSTDATRHITATIIDPGGAATKASTNFESGWSLSGGTPTAHGGSAPAGGTLTNRAAGAQYESYPGVLSYDVRPADQAGTTFILFSSGQLLARYGAASRTVASPATSMWMGSDGSLFFLEGSTLYSVANGSLTPVAYGTVEAKSFSVDAMGTLYLLSTDGTLYASRTGLLAELSAAQFGVRSVALALDQTAVNVLDTDGDYWQFDGTTWTLLAEPRLTVSVSQPTLPPNEVTAGAPTATATVTATAFDYDARTGAWDTPWQVAAYTATVTFASTDPAAGLPGSYTFTAADAGSHTFAVTFKTVVPAAAGSTTLGTQTLSVTDNQTPAAVTGSAVVTVNPAAAVGFTVAPVVGSTVAGTQFGVAVTAVDAYGNAVVNYAGTVRLTSSDANGSAVLPASYTFTAGTTASDNGVHVFPVTLVTGGGQTVSATDGAGLIGTGQLAVTPAAFSAARSTLVVGPTSVTAGGTATVVLTARDAYGNPLTTGGLSVLFNAGAADDGLVYPGQLPDPRNPGQYVSFVDNGDGTYTGLIVVDASAVTAEAATVTAQVNNQHLSATAKLNVAVATPLATAGTYYVRLDADGQHIDVWTNAAATGTSQQFTLAQVSVLTLTPTSTGGSITIDESAGNVIPAGGLTLAGSTPLKLVGTAGTDTLTLNAGQLVFDGLPINFTAGVPVTFDPHGGTDALTVNAGALTLAAPAAGGGLTARRFSSLTVGNGATLAVANPDVPADRAVLVVSALSVAGSNGVWSGKLDLGANDLLVRSGSLGTLTAMAASGFANGLWTGTGLTDAAAAADGRHLTGLGVIQNVGSNGTTPLYASFDGQPVAATDVLVRHTYYGDTNLDGSITAADYTRVDYGYILHLSGWANGDFNYDGVVDGSDYSLVDNAFNQQSGGVAAPAAAAPQAAVGVVTARLAYAVVSTASTAASRRPDPARATPAAPDGGAASPFADAAPITAAGSVRWSTPGLDSFWAKRQRDRLADLI